MKNVLIAADVDRSFEARANGDPRFTITRRPVRTEEELLQVIGDAEVLVTRAYNKVTRRVIDAAPKLELIAQGTSGIDNVDLDAAAERGIRVIHMPGVNANAVAELVIGFMISMTRTVPFYTREVAHSRFERDDCATRHELAHFRVGIVGLGNVGSLVARYASVFGMRVFAYDPYITDCGTTTRVTSLPELLATTDILTLHVPLTPETRHLIGARELALMRPDAALVNVSRGPVVDEAALVEALNAGRIAGAALDVYEHEPDVSAGLLELENVVLSPHLGSSTHAARDAMGMLCAEALEAVLLRDELPAHAVNPEAWDAD